MINLKNMCFKLFTISFIAIFSYIFILSIINPYEYGREYNINTNVVILYLILFIILFLGIKRGIDRINNKKLLWFIVMGCFVIIVSLQLIFINEFKVISYYDLNNLYAEAMRLLQGNEVVENTVYFGMYPFQFTTTLIIYVVFKVCTIFGVEDYKLALSIFNMFMIDIGFLIGFIYMVKRYELKKGLISIILIMFFPPIYTYVPYFYTDTITMIFPIILLILYMLYLRTNKAIEKVFYLICIGISIFIGYKIRATVLIIGIAIGIHLIFVKNLKKFIVYLLIISGICISGNLLYSNIQERFFDNDYSESSFPTTHWIMMGLQGEGGYSQKDVDLTNSVETREEKVNTHIIEIEKRIKENGVTGNTQLINNKIRRVWVHGTYGYLHYLKRFETYGKLYPYIAGERNLVFLYYNHVYNSFLILMVVIGAISTLRKSKYKIAFLGNIILFGWFLFYLLWETHPRYMLAISPIILINSLIGLEYLYEQTIKVNRVNKITLDGFKISSKVIDLKKIKKSINISVLGVIFLGTIVIGIFNYDECVLKNDVEIDFVINQDTKRGKNPIGELTSDKEVIQTFKTNKSFNRIELVFNTYGKEVTSDYIIQLVDIDNKSLIKDWILNAREIQNRKFTKISLDTINPDETTKYGIIISSHNAKLGDALSLDTYYYKDYDIMTNGNLYINGESTEADLQFKVYNETNKDLIRYDNYIFIVIVIAIIQCLVIGVILKSLTDEKILD